MIDRSICTGTQCTTIDLLPWADPYIAQLFADAHLVDIVEPQESPLHAAWRGVRVACETSLRSMLPKAPGGLKARRPARPSRKRRTGFAHSLASC